VTARDVVFMLLILLLVGALKFVGAAHARETAIQEANLAAALDTTRLTLHDSVAAKTRLATQAGIVVDSLDRALALALEDRDATALSLTRVEIKFDELQLLAQSPTRDTVFVEGKDSTRVATFKLEGPPIEGSQTVSVTDKVRLDSFLRVTPFTTTYAVACAGTDAVVSWSVPEWVQATHKAGKVDPIVCNPLQPGLFQFDAGDGVAFGAGVVLTLLLTLAR